MPDAPHAVEPRIIRGDARNLPLPDASVDLIVTSPPYWSLRSYRDGGEHYAGQIGSEPTPQEYIDNLLDCTREWMRVLKPTGSLFVNLGDKYGPDKSLLDLPWRYSIRCVDDLGLIKRAEIVWAKVNGLPESVQDRVRRSHEVFLHLTKSPRYFAAVDEIREPTDVKVDAHVKRYTGRDYGKTNTHRGDLGASNFVGNPLGKLPGSVWEIATQPLRVPAELGVQHFAAFPMEIPRRLILGWSPREVCTACGEGRRPVTEVKREVDRYHARQNLGKTFDPNAVSHHPGDAPEAASTLHMQATRTITGYACACPGVSAPSTPGVVLDPFGGTGTTALVAAMHGRQGISVDLSADYCRLAEWRVNDPKQRERASRSARAKPAPTRQAAPIPVAADQPELPLTA